MIIETGNDKYPIIIVDYGIENITPLRNPKELEEIRMSFLKAIEYKKEKRKEYKGGKAVCKSCRNHGGCPYCEDNRTYKNKQKDKITKKELNDYER